MGEQQSKYEGILNLAYNQVGRISPNDRSMREQLIANLATAIREGNVVITDECAGESALRSIKRLKLMT